MSDADQRNARSSSPPPPEADADEERRRRFVGKTLAGRYTVLEPLRSGGTAHVYRARDEQLEREVAVKVLRDLYATEDSIYGRFEREAKALAALSHPNIVPLIDFGIDRHLPYLVMELLRGRILRDVMDEGPISPDRAFSIGGQVLGALAFAHDGGLVHRDLKPGNVFLQELPGSGEHVRLLDFGFAKIVSGDLLRHGRPLTRVGTAFGTPAYMAPEQIQGRPVDGRTDVYAAGVLLFEMLAGRKPYVGDVRDVLRDKLKSPPPRLGDVREDLRVPEELELLLQHAMAQVKEQRIESAATFLAELERVPHPVEKRSAIRSRRPSARGPGGARRSRVGLVLLAGATLLVCGAGAYFALSQYDATDPAEPRTAPPRSVAAPSVVIEPGAAELPPAPRADPQWLASDAPPEARDPWSYGPVPALLAELRDAVEANGRLSAGETEKLVGYATNHAADPRPHLLLARVATLQGDHDEALLRYERAYRIDRGARGNPHMQEDLLGLVAEGHVGARANRTVATIYGAEALVPVDAMLERSDLPPGAARRLQRLRTRLLSSPR